MVRTLPRIVIAAPSSGHGKTTVATGLMAALRRNGRTVAPFKVGPNYIDPGYDALATGVPGRNLDPHLTSPEQLVPLMLLGAATPRQADIAVIEGLIGLDDGSIGGDGFASTAHVARLLGAPVILVVDISAASRSIAATVHGMAAFDPRVRIAGVILDKFGSVRHSDGVIDAMAQTGIPVLGVLNRDDRILAPSRSLGLVAHAERAEAAASIDRLATHIAANIDVDEVVRIAASAADITGEPWPPDAVVSPPAPVPQASEAVDLGHHGDLEIGDGLVDFAVNVRLDAPPDWLVQVVNNATMSLAAYPRTDRAIEALARRHRRHVSEVLPTSGGAEAFTLLARALPPHQAVVVHPQFTEPEAALQAAGHEVIRVVLRAGDGFSLRPDLVPDAAKSVFIGNPTNPTGTLHRADLLRALARPGRIVVVDEAFMDATPGERQSLVQQAIPGLVVIRSLTKTWGIAGLRAGYAVGDPAIIAAMAAQQPTWSVASPALAAIVACSEPRAVDAAESAAALIVRDRQILVDGLARLGITVAGDPQTPFVLADTTAAKPPGAPPGWLRTELREAGFAVRRCDTFPGLHADWVRIAVRTPALTRRLLQAVSVLSGRAHDPDARR